MKRLGFPFLFAAMLYAGPPGATIQVKVDVPLSLRTGIFSSDRLLNVPPGFRIGVWTALDGARFMAAAPNGDVFVSQPGAGKVILFRPDPAGGPPAQFTYVSGLEGPHGLAFDTIDSITYLYVGEVSQIDRYIYTPGDTAAQGRAVIVKNLPSGGHSYKNIAVGPDHQLYVGIGSSCNACVEDTTSTPVRASIYVYQPDGSGGRPFARGLRNAEGLAFIPGTNKLWAAVNNRDDLLYPYRDQTGNYGKLVKSYVDDHPPEPVTAVRDGGNYGWPFCVATQDGPTGFANMQFDLDMDWNRDAHVDCSKMDRVSRGIQAHSAPLQFAFAQNTQFAAAYRTGAILALHGSWDRQQPTGYKVIYFPWNSTAQTPGPPVDLVSGWLKDDGAFGRPAGILIQSEGSLLISDDQGGIIYRVTYSPGAVSAGSGYAVVSPDSYAAVYGTNLDIANGQLSLTDSTGKLFPAPIAFASASQLNFVVPRGVAQGTARLTLATFGAERDLGTVEVRPISPSIFSATGGGSGVAAALSFRTGENPEPVFSCAQWFCRSNPLDVTSGTRYVALFGTGVRAASPGSVQVTVNDLPVPVLYAGAQGVYAGLDQINIALPASFAGAGDVQVLVVARGTSSNPVTLTVQ